MELSGYTLLSRNGYAAYRRRDETPDTLCARVWTRWVCVCLCVCVCVYIHERVRETARACNHVRASCAFAFARARVHAQTFDRQKRARAASLPHLSLAHVTRDPPVPPERRASGQRLQKRHARLRGNPRRPQPRPGQRQMTIPPRLPPSPSAALASSPACIRRVCGCWSVGWMDACMMDGCMLKGSLYTRMRVSARQQAPP